jgi:hypothetical protein
MHGTVNGIDPIFFVFIFGVHARVYILDDFSSGSRSLSEPN